MEVAIWQSMANWIPMRKIKLEPHEQRKQEHFLRIAGRFPSVFIMNRINEILSISKKNRLLFVSDWSELIVHIYIHGLF